MRYLFLIICMASTLVLPGQEADCEAIQSEVVPLQKLDEDSVMLRVYHNIRSFSACGLDSVDVQIILESPFLSTLLVEHATNSTVLTYGDIYHKYLIFSENEGFNELKQNFIFIQELEHRKVTRAHWAADKEQLRKLGVDDNIILAIEEKLGDNNVQDRTYAELMQEIRSDSRTIAPSNPPSLDGLAPPNQKVNWAYQNMELEEAKTISRDTNKPLILFFTGHASINAVKMEENVLADPAIETRLKEEFVFVPLYVDEKAKREGQQKSIGRLNLGLQMNEFGANHQPYLVVLDVDGNLVATMGYTLDKESFSRFLNESGEE